MKLTFNNGQSYAFDLTQVKIRDALGGYLYYRYEDGERVYYQKELKIIDNKEREILVPNNQEDNPFDGLFIVKERESEINELNLLP